MTLCCGYVTFWYGSGSDSRNGSCYFFSSVTFKMATKNYFFLGLFCLLLFEGTFTSYRRIPIRTSNKWIRSGSGRPKNIWILLLLRIRNTKINCTQHGIVRITETEFEDDSSKTRSLSYVFFTVLKKENKKSDDLMI
jgi:hypothetical protein